MNSVVRQLHEANTDVVMADTGNSYEGLCEYLGGKYIAYTEEKPITMNPFNISKEELNIEKIDFLKNLILMIWKGTDDKISELEFRIVEQIVTEYYDVYFSGLEHYTPSKRDNIRSTLMAAEKRRDATRDAKTLNDLVNQKITDLEARRRALKVSSLSFNTFYEYSTEALEIICVESNIADIDYDKYRFMLQPFYKGGNYEKILNESVDSTLFSETFIVFEVDAIKENKKVSSKREQKQARLNFAEHEKLIQTLPDCHSDNHGCVSSADASQEEQECACHRRGMEGNRLATWKSRACLTPAGKFR